MVLIVLNVADVSRVTFIRGIALLTGLAVWLYVFFRFLLERRGTERWVAWLAITIDVGFATGMFALLKGEVPSAQLIFVPVIMATVLLLHLVGFAISRGRIRHGAQLLRVAGIVVAAEVGLVVLILPPLFSFG